MDGLAVMVAAFFQLLGGAFFFAQTTDRCSPAPTLGSWLFLLATLRYLWDVSIYPQRFNHMGRGWQLMIEIVAAIFLVELATMFIWCGIERFLFGLTNELLGESHCGCERSPYLYWISGLITFSAGAAVLWYVLKATDSTYYIQLFYCLLRTNVNNSIRMMRCFFKLSQKNRRRVANCAPPEPRCPRPPSCRTARPLSSRVYKQESDSKCHR